jgi:elongation factor P--beta-lysine ligase
MMTRPNFNQRFLYRYPASQAALAKRDPSDERYALRVELYIGDLELCNGFEELSNPEEQRARFEEEIAYAQNARQKDVVYRRRSSEGITSPRHLFGQCLRY